MNKFYNILINGMKIRPQMYFGDKKLSSLYHFINGYDLALKLNNCEPLTPSIYDFNCWIAKKYKAGLSSNFYSVLIQECNNNEEEALTLFFELFEEFLELV
jgi:hypothetical protein